ncbi:MAG: response regulator [Ignavibacteriaceae bacterium]
MSKRESAKSKIRVMIADDHPIVREGLKQFISKTSDMTVVDEAANGQEILDKLKTVHCDVLILDINMPGKDGFEVLLDLKKFHSDLRVLVLSIHSETQVATRVLSSGAYGFINKETIKDDLLTAIRSVYISKKYVSPHLTEKLIDLLDRGSIKPPHERLSNREFQVFCKIASGHSQKQIADTLSISIKTVRTYKSRILKKMNLKNEVELAHYALKHGLIEPSGIG